MQITEFDVTPKWQIPFLNAGRRGGDYRREFLPIHVGRAKSDSADVHGWVVAADLQGRETFQSSCGQAPRL